MCNISHRYSMSMEQETEVNGQEEGSLTRVKHEHEFILDLDSQVTCSKCGAMDDDIDPHAH